MAQTSAAPAIALMAVSAFAFALANSPFEAHYFASLAHPLAIGVGELTLQKPILLWINDGLMALFFLLVGLEVKRELHSGQLSSPRRAALPMAAALGGMVVPAAVYSLVAGGLAPEGWGIPMATDIAFALGVLALLGSRVPVALIIFLTAFAVADDIGAVLVIALFYTRDLATGPLGVAGLGTLILVAMNLLGVRRARFYLLVGAVLWVAVLKSGVHATVAGLVTALAIPHGGAQGSTLLRLEHRLAPWVAWGVLPIFALANAGVNLGPDFDPWHPVALGVAAGLVGGKLVGVGGASWLAVRLGLAELPEGVGWTHVIGLSLLGGIGFTMAIFIASLAFVDPAQVEIAKAGVILGSVVAGALGTGVLLLASNARAPARASLPAA